MDKLADYMTELLREKMPEIVRIALTVETTWGDSEAMARALEEQAGERVAAMFRQNVVGGYCEGKSAYTVLLCLAAFGTIDMQMEARDDG
jgi:hypothetical protein